MRSYQRRRLGMQGRYIPVEAVIVPAAGYVEFPIDVNATGWEFEGAVGWKAGSLQGNSRFISNMEALAYRGTRIGYLNNSSFSVKIDSTQSASWSIARVSGKKIAFRTYADSAEVNGTSKDLTYSGKRLKAMQNLRIGDSTAKASSVVFWYLKAWHNGVLMGDYIPARRRDDGVLGLYDKVTGVFLLPTDGALTEFVGGG